MKQANKQSNTAGEMLTKEEIAKLRASESPWSDMSAPVRSRRDISTQSKSRRVAVL